MGGERVERVFPRVQRAAAVLQRWLLETDQGALAHQDLDHYLDEFTFCCSRSC